MPHTPENVENNSEVSHQTTFEKHKAERWERYLQAVKQLRSKEASARVSGVHALVVLVDEWLHEENLSEDEKIKEGQFIINKLCAYICSPFTLASEYDELTQDSPAAEGLYKNREQEFYIHKAELQAEADVRLSIMKEIHARLQGPDENTPGAWSDFEYDFSGSTFFYPVDLTRSYYTKPVHFSESVYRSSANFSGSTYRDWVGFSDSTYRGRADFSGSTYRGGADFHESIYQAEVDLSKSVYQDWADFHESTYWGDAKFSESAYRSWTDLQNSIYQGQADFSGSAYQEGVDLSCSIYWGRANFRGSIYEDEAAFSGSIFRDTIDCGKDTGSGGSSRFTRCAPAFYDEANQQNTLFGAPNNDFSAENSEGCPVLLTPDGVPLDCRFLSTAQKDYLENTLRRLEETNDEFLAAKNHEVEKELSEKLRFLTQELDEWRREVTALPSESPNNTEAPPQQTKYMKRPEEEVPWSPAGREAFSLLDDYRKNSNDHAKIYAVIKDILESHERQIKILAEQTQQCIENAFKERMAERRGRYAKAVEQLGNANAPVRLGGVYTLVSLVDEWLREENIEYNERIAEGQVIINNLCTYIRSPFALTSHYDELTQESPTAEGLYKNREQEFYIDKATLKSEADIRLSILKEIHRRLQGPDENTPGTWSDFEYDFSGSIFFYPVDLTNSYYQNPLISAALPTGAGLISVTPRIRIRPTSAHPPIAAGLISAIPSIESGLFSVVPPTWGGLTSTTLSIRMGLNSASPLTRVRLCFMVPPIRVRLTSVFLPIEAQLILPTPSTRAGLLSIVPLIGVWRLSTVLPTRIGLPFMAPPTWKGLTSMSPFIEVKLTSTIPLIGIGLTLPTPPIKTKLTSAIPSIGVGPNFAALPIGIVLILVGLFSIVTLLWAKTKITIAFLVSHNAPLNSTTKQTTKTRSLARTTIISQPKTAEATPSTATLKAYPSAVLS